MPRLPVLAVGMGLALAPIAAPTPAAGECSTPRWTSLPDGVQVPTRGTFYLRDGGLATEEPWVPPRIEWSGLLPGFARATRVGPQVVRVDYAGPSGARLTVRDVWNEEPVGLLSMLHLGETGCGPANVTLDRFVRGSALELHAIHFDGTEQWIRNMPRDFDLADVPTVTLGVRLVGVDPSHPALAAR